MSVCTCPRARECVCDCVCVRAPGSGLQNRKWAPVWNPGTWSWRGKHHVCGPSGGKYPTLTKYPASQSHLGRFLGGCSQHSFPSRVQPGVGLPSRWSSWSPRGWSPVSGRTGCALLRVISTCRLAGGEDSFQGTSVGRWLSSLAGGTAGGHRGPVVGGPRWTGSVQLVSVALAAG